MSAYQEAQLSRPAEAVTNIGISVIGGALGGGALVDLSASITPDKFLNDAVFLIIAGVLIKAGITNLIRIFRSRQQKNIVDNS